MPRKPQGDRAMSSTERVHAFRMRQRAKNPVLTDRQKLAEARQEIEQLRKAAVGIEATRRDADLLQEENASLRKRVQDLEKALGSKPKPKSEPKPSLDPGSEAARQIKALKTRVRNLQDQLAMERNTFLKLGRMDFATRSLIAKVLHPEATLSDKVRADAYKAFTAWTADSKAAGR